jgi:RND family efflux transporter MFP subunit
MAPTSSFLRRRWRTIAACIGVVAAGGLLLAARGDGNDSASGHAPLQIGSASSWKAITVGQAVAARPRWTDPISARVVIDETRTSRIGSPLDGRVTSVNVQRGQTVTSGTPLFTVASADLAGLYADRDRAVVEQAAAKANLDRTQQLIDTDFAPAKDLLAARQQYDEATVAVRLAQSKLAALKVSSKGGGTFTVTAPRDGMVVERNVDLGQTVTGEAGGLVVIADLSSVWVVADLFEQDVGKLAIGDKAQVCVETVLDKCKWWDGVVDQVSKVIDPDRHTVPVRVRLDNRDGLFRPYSRAIGRFLDGSPPPVEVPAAAVLSDGEHSYVYIPRDAGGFARKDVVAGSPREDWTPIYDGLAVGDRVVTGGATLLDNQIAN